MEGAEPRVGRARLTTGVHTGKGELAGPPEQPHVADRRVRLPKTRVKRVCCSHARLDEKAGIEGPGPGTRETG